MIQERLTIKNFGPIKELDIEIKPLMVFIGESGSGKSAILKLMSLLRWVHKQNNLQTFLKQKDDISLQKLFFDNLFVTEIEEFVTEKTRIEFIFGNTKYKLSANKKFTFKQVKREDITFDKIVFLTENRGILPYVKNNKISLSISSLLPYYFQDTFDNFNKANESRKDSDFKINSTNLVLFNEKSDKNQLFVKDEKGKKFKIKLENSSSGTKTALPLELIVNYCTNKFDFNEVLSNAYVRAGLGSIVTKDFNNAKNLSFFIEEPELSLFPAAQRRLINRLVKDCFTENKQENCTTRLAFATHSPYIVNHLNLLIQAFDKQNTEFTNGASISYDDLGVWLIQDGKLRDLKYRDRHFIYTMVLSDDINQIYNHYDELQNG